jgi:hypothetical protein
MFSYSFYVSNFVLKQDKHLEGIGKVRMLSTAPTIPAILKSFSSIPSSLASISSLFSLYTGPNIRMIMIPAMPI